jgi:hypothetical protein
MEKAILLALAASFCTAMASVCQRRGAKSNEVTGFDVWLIFRLARRPVWLLGLASMILGFVFQISALRFGPLGPGPAHPRSRTALCFRLHGRHRPAGKGEAA